MKTKKALVFFITLSCCLAIIGYILLGTDLLKFDTTAKYFTIFGLTAILFLTILKFWNTREFILLGLLISLFIVYVWSRNSSLPVVIRNSLWFITIGAFTWLSHEAVKLWSPSNLKIVPPIVWIISFNCIYLIMLIFNLYVFGFYSITGDLTFIYYLKLAMRYGTTIGLGIGLGSVLADIIIKNLKILNR